MKRLSLTVVGLAVATGCSTQTPSKLGGSVPAQVPDRVTAETVLENVKLHDAGVQEVAAPVKAQILDDMRFRAAEKGSPEATVEVRLARIGDLRAQHLFHNTYLSDDVQVVLATAKGEFQAGAAESGAAGRAYTRLVGMFDPVTGETLATGLQP